MGLFSSIFGGGGKAPELRPPGPDELQSLKELGTRGAAGTQLATGAVEDITALRGPELATQLQALGSLLSLLTGGQFTSPTVEEAIRRQRGDVEERVRRQLGPGGEVSTPGRESLAAFGTQSELLREGARTEELSRLLQVLGLLGPQTRQTASIGFAEPSPGIVRTTGVQERLGELGARSNVASAALRSQSDILGGLIGPAAKGFGGFLGQADIGSLLRSLIGPASIAAAPITGGFSLGVPPLTLGI